MFRTRPVSKVQWVLRRSGTMVVFIVAGALLSAWLAPTVQAFDWDAFPDLEIGVHPESPFTVTEEFDSTFYEVQATENVECGAPPNKAVGANSAWLRFSAPVVGSLVVRVSSPGAEFYPILKLYSNNAFVTCAYARKTTDQPQAEVRVAPNVPIDIQTLGETEEELAGVPQFDPSPYPGPYGGNTDVVVTFVPDDQDHDGVPDTKDQCPTEPGPASLAGCPDADRDGIPNRMDRCPNQAGLSRYEGCPDSDGDGLPDELDRCPAQAGPAIYEGCPDSDGDGIPDELDRCPTEPALASVSVPIPGSPGCPGKLISTRKVKYGASTGRGVPIVAFKEQVPAGTHLTVSCSGRACRRRHLLSLTAQMSEIPLGALLAHGRLRRNGKLWLPVGVTITVTATHAGALGRVDHYSVSRGGRRHYFESCLSSSGKTVRCPAT